MSGSTAARRVVLVGFMGAGKSSVGAELARILGWEFVDMDRRIEELAGADVSTVFAERGEAAFRALEWRVARELAERRDVVVAAGGGAFAEEATRDELGRGALTVWLRCDLATLLGRIAPGRGRPLAGSRETMRALLERREPAYKRADRVLDTAALPPDEIARRIAVMLGRTPGDVGLRGR